MDEKILTDESYYLTCLSVKSTVQQQFNTSENPQKLRCQYGMRIKGYQQDSPDYVRWSREQKPIFFNPKLSYWVVNCNFRMSRCSASTCCSRSNR